MISMKKALFVLCLGIGLSSSYALARPSYDTCVDMQESCEAGDANACYHFKRLCSIYGL